MAVQPFAATKRNDYLIEASVTQTAGARASAVEERARSRFFAASLSLSARLLPPSPLVSTAMYANNVRELVRKQLLQAPPGVATQNIPAAIEEKKALEAAKSSA
jgi:hypothetical protein